MNEEQRVRFEALIRDSSHAMFRLARSVLPCGADAEDAVGEAVLRAWQSFHGLRDPEKASSWLLRITLNCARAQYRKRSKVSYLEELGQIPAPEQEERTDIWQSLRQLPEEQRLPLILYYDEELPVAEIARVLGVPQGTVKSRLSRGRERLRQILKKEEFCP